jgi:hypothetical protein
LFEAHVLGHRDHSGFAQADMLREDTMQRATQVRPHDFAIDLTCLPSLEEAAHHTLAALPLRYSLTNRENLPGAIGAWDERSKRAGALYLRGNQIAEVHRDRVHSHQHFSRAGLRIKKVYDLQCVKGSAMLDLPRFHSDRRSAIGAKTGV